MSNNHRTAIEIPIPLHKEAKKYKINVSEMAREGIRKEVENRQLLEKIENGTLTETDKRLLLEKIDKGELRTVPTN